jgi:membrane protease YdiL (CAAX protease family)
MILNQIKRGIAKHRIRFLFYEIALTFLVIFLISSLESILIPLKSSPEVLGMIFYVIRAIIVLFAIPFTISVMKRVAGPSEKEMSEKTKISVFTSHFMLYKISRSNYKFQLLYGILLLFLVFMPLNFFLYLLIPEMITYRFISSALILQNSYLFIDNFIIFFTLSVIIQISIAFVEETVYRGFVNKRGSEHFNGISAVFISAYSYAFLSLLYYLSPAGISAFNWFPLIWFISSFTIGLILSLLTLRKKWLFPAIFAHSISNVIMISMIWCFLNGWNYFELITFIYTPLLCVSLILLISQYKRIRDGVSIGMEMLRKYVKNDEELDERNNDKYFRIFFDIVIGFLVFLIGFLITI